MEFQGGTIEFFKHKLNVLKGHCDDVGRNFDEITQSWSVSCVAVGDTEQEAEQVARKSPFFTEDGVIYGTPDQLIQAFKEREAACCHHFQLRFADFPSPEGIKRFAKDVLLTLRSCAAYRPLRRPVQLGMNDVAGTASSDALQRSVRL